MKTLSTLTITMALAPMMSACGTATEAATRACLLKSSQMRTARRRVPAR